MLQPPRLEQQGLHRAAQIVRGRPQEVLAPLPLRLEPPIRQLELAHSPERLGLDALPGGDIAALRDETDDASPRVADGAEREIHDHEFRAAATPVLDVVPDEGPARGLRD